MDKELHETLNQVTMYSKMGRYISNKILKYSKRVKTHRNSRNSQPHRTDYLRVKNVLKRKSFHSQERSRLTKQLNFTQPPVGYYKINFSQTQKNTRLYDFNRSVPHFNRDKYYCHQNKPVKHDIPDSQLSKSRVKGLTQLSRMAGRQDIKGSIRKQIEDPHENRFKLKKDLNSIEFGRTRVNMKKDLARDNIAFKIYESVPQYDYQVRIPQKRLDTHIIPFQRILDRNQKAITCQKGISNFFNSHKQNILPKTYDWKAMLPREKTGILPSYMDKNINTRSSIGLVNLKTLQMNCSELKQNVCKNLKRPKRCMIFIEQKDQGHKQNMGVKFPSSN